MGRRQPRRGPRQPPLPVRDGLNPARLRLPDEPWSLVVDHLRARFPDDIDRLADKIAAGEVRWDDGRECGPVTPDTAYRAGLDVYLYRDPAPEPEIPFAIDVLHTDDHLIVVDKPHFLATTPRGLHVVNSVVVRLRRLLAEPEISPAHRLDRLTAGVLVLTRRAVDRGAYQLLFARRAVHKEYLAVAPVRPELSFPMTVRSRMVKERGSPIAREVPGEANAETGIELLTDDGSRGGYRVRPTTGRTHQIRLHFSSLGIPVVGDPFYPELREVDRTDFSAPLQLLSRHLAFDDPITGRHREFSSRRTLADWPDPTAGEPDRG